VHSPTARQGFGAFDPHGLVDQEAEDFGESVEYGVGKQFHYGLENGSIGQLVGHCQSPSVGCWSNYQGPIGVRNLSGKKGS